MERARVRDRSAMISFFINGFLSVVCAIAIGATAVGTVAMGVLVIEL
jgi:hypothetical protein